MSPAVEMPNAQRRNVTERADGAQRSRYADRGSDVEVQRGNADGESRRQYCSLMLDTAERNEFVIHSYEYYADFVHAFGERSQLFFALADGNIASVLIAAAFGTEAIYMYGASS